MRNPLSWIQDRLKSRNQDASSSEQEEKDRDTGPIQSPHLSHYEQSRALIDSFDEDRLDRWDKAKMLAAKIVALVLPLIAIWAVGSLLGQFFANGQTFTLSDSWVMSQYLIAYAGETALAAMTYVLGMVLGSKPDNSNKWHAVKVAITVSVWLLFILASALGQWYVSIRSLASIAGTIGYITIGMRVGMACSLDIAAVCLMWYRGRTLAQFLDQQGHKAQAIRAVNESELEIERAQVTADLRRKEDEQYLAGKQAREQVLLRIEEIQAQALIAHAERALLTERVETRERGYY